MTVIESRTSTTRNRNQQLPTTSGTESARSWTAACTVDALVPGRGVAVLLRGGTQVALFALPDARVFAVGNIDPFGRAAVMSRGLVGDRSGEPTVASPLLKQVFSLLDGRCLDVSDISLGSFETKISGGVIFVRGAST
ncbi:nitrite reductase small subunit [Rhodococcus sp. 1163]|uniref:nitrite reductase small subunit NirD n=1 Tax=unclassified Rhodococcus (in: high G+C Gram-positive bacteria) TaxID=192944 RepID=UPI000A01B424|nr:nitrite reductase small subunit NirD [Rhodococcus sp. 1163]ORI15894.1 nitrite reductase small subunit [Rhodococcus sp. 1163]